MIVWAGWPSALHVAISWRNGGSGRRSLSVRLPVPSRGTLVGAPCRCGTRENISELCVCSTSPGPAAALGRHAFPPLPVSEAGCSREASAVWNAEIDLHVGMWPLLPECGPDVRLPGEDARNVTASFFGASLLLPRWRSLPFDALLGSEKQEPKRGR